MKKLIILFLLTIGYIPLTTPIAVEAVAYAGLTLVAKAANLGCAGLGAANAGLILAPTYETKERMKRLGKAVLFLAAHYALQHSMLACLPTGMQVAGIATCFIGAATFGILLHIIAPLAYVAVSALYVGAKIIEKKAQQMGY